MSLLNRSINKSRGGTRASNNYQNYVASSVNRRNDTNLLTQNYNSYYGNPSLSKDIKTNPTGSHLSSFGASKDSGLLPKISTNV